MASVKRRHYQWWWMSWIRVRCFCYSFLVLLTVLWSSELTFVKCYGMNQMSPRVVFTKQGPVQGYLGPVSTGGLYHLPHLAGGSNFNIRQYGGRPIVEIFKGIPYASALRYESPAPVPARSQTEVFIANITRPPCPRTSEEVLNRTAYPDNPLRALKKTLDIEECLFLDIFAPLNSDRSRGAGLAILVYMNSHIDDPEDPFDGSSMAAIGNIIVVSVRYRTGVLGFLQPSFSEDVRSNFGLWDQLAALQWIKENLNEFGGDVSKVTCLGYDLDATLAGLLALSPVSQAYNGLFHRMILLNGSPFTPNAISNQPLKTTYQLARAIPCPLDERSGELAKCLRSMPIPRLMAAEKNIGAPTLSYPFSPIIDGTLVSHEINNPNGLGHSQAVKDMLGKYDILCGLKEGPVLPKMGRHTFNNIDMDRFITAVIKLTMKMEPGSEPTADVKRAVLNAIVQEYGTSPPMRELLSDFLMVNPMIDLLNTHSETGKNTFFYVFKDYDPLHLNKHDEISYIFSSNVYKWKYVGTPSHTFDLHPFVLLINLLSNFVRSGDPNVVDPSDRFPNPIKSWPKYKADYGRYLEISKDIQFPSGYRKTSTDFWGKSFLSIIKSFANNSATDPNNYGEFPYFPKNYNTYNRGVWTPNTYPYGNSGIGLDINNGDKRGNYDESGVDDSQSIIVGGPSTVVLVGCLLLVLNFLCFMGLFYQKERLKKAEIQLRKRYLETQKQLAGTEALQDVECSSSFAADRSPTNHLQHHHHLPPIQRDAMSETETENGFGPDFLGPNYDPRTKVNRWMQMQNANRMISKGNSFEEYSNPTPTPSDMHRHRLSRVREDENQYEPAPGAPIYQMCPSPQIIGLNQLPYIPPQPPMQIQVNSLQRPHAIQPPKAQPEGPVQFLPQLPYQDPYRPSGHLGSDIPYADSRATSPSIISAPAGFSNAREGKPGAGAPKTPAVGPIMKPSPSTSQTPSTPIPYSIAPSSTNAFDSPKSTSILVSPTSQGPKRSSTLIVRDLDPPDLDSEPKYVTVKSGTLKRSVGVDTDHDNSPAAVSLGDNNGYQDITKGAAKGQGAKSGPSQIRVTFKESL